MSNPTTPLKPPTIGHLREMGLRAAWMTCAESKCQRSHSMSFDDLCLPDDMPFSTVASARKWVCSECGGRRVAVTPDWAAVLLGWDRSLDAL